MHLVKMDDKTAKEIAAAADAFFDKEGKEKNRSNTSGINAVRAPRQQLPPALKQQQTTRAISPENLGATGFTSSFEEDDTDIHAVRFKQGQRQRVNVNNSGGGRPQSRGRYTNSSNSSSSRPQSQNRYGNASSSSSRGAQPKYDSNSKVCFYHTKFGKDARSCTDTCAMNSTFKAGNDKARH